MPLEGSPEFRELFGSRPVQLFSTIRGRPSMQCVLIYRGARQSTLPNGIHLQSATLALWITNLVIHEGFCRRNHYDSGFRMEKRHSLVTKTLPVRGGCGDYNILLRAETFHEYVTLPRIWIEAKDSCNS